MKGTKLVQKKQSELGITQRKHNNYVHLHHFPFIKPLGLQTAYLHSDIAWRH